jgi:hypothetical protein
MFFKVSFIALFCVFSLSAQAETGKFWPSCDLSILNAKGEALSSVALKINGFTYSHYVEGGSPDQVLHEGRLGDLYARVEHFIGITSLTMELNRGSESLLVSLARVPTENNPQSFSKVKIAEGKWAMIECETQEYRW